MNEVWAASVVMLWIVVAVLGFLLAGALRQLGILHLRLGDDPGALITDSGLERGTYAPDFEGWHSETGRLYRLSEMDHRPRVLVFLTPTCVACQQLIPHLNEVAETRREEFDFWVICYGESGACRALAQGSRLKVPMLIDESGAAAELYDVRFTPFSYLLDHQGRVLLRGVANDWRQLESLLSQEGTLQEGKEWATVPLVAPADIQLEESSHAS